MITHEDVFKACLDLEPGFNNNHVEDILGLRKNVLQRLFNTPAFRKLDSGVMLATRDFDKWCILAGITFSSSEVIVTQSSAWDRRDIAELYKAALEFDWNAYVKFVLCSATYQKDSVTELAKAASLLVYLMRYAESDPRGKTDYQSIWETRVL